MAPTDAPSQGARPLIQTLGVVIPVFRGGQALTAVCLELLEVVGDLALSSTVSIRLESIHLVVDNPVLADSERAALSDLEALDPRIRVIWLSANFGQHPATVAGIVSTNSDWIVTMDEDGQHNPVHIPDMLRNAGESLCSLIYADPTNARPHGLARNATSWLAGKVARYLVGTTVRYHSYRVIEGSLARAACAYAGQNVFLDVALGWTCGEAGLTPVILRSESEASSYNFRRLLSHFWRMVLSSGTRPLRVIALGGAAVAVGGVVAGAYVIQQRLSGVVMEQGWTSVVVALLILFGGMYISLAILAEYVGLVVRNTIGRPTYVKVDGPQSRALFALRDQLRRDAPAGGP